MAVDIGGGFIRSCRNRRARAFSQVPVAVRAKRRSCASLRVSDYAPMGAGAFLVDLLTTQLAL